MIQLRPVGTETVTTRCNFQRKLLWLLFFLVPFAPSLVQRAKASYTNCTTSEWLVPCPWNPALDVRGTTTYCVYRSSAVSEVNDGDPNTGGGSVSDSLDRGGGSGRGLSNWVGAASAIDDEICLPEDDDEDPCEEPKITASRDECDPCDEPNNTESAGSFVDLWGLKYYDSYHDIQIAVPGGWLSTTRSYSQGAWRMDGTNYLAKEPPAAGNLMRLNMSGRVFTQIAEDSTTFTSEEYIIEFIEGATWQDSELILTEPDGSWASYKGTVADGAILWKSGFKQNTYLIYDHDWGSYDSSQGESPESLRLLQVSSGMEDEGGLPKVLLTYNYAPTDFTKLGKDYPMLTSIVSSSGMSVEYEYFDGAGESGLLRTVKKADGTRSEYTYDTNDNLRTKTEYDSHTGGNVTKSATIDYLPTTLNANDAIESRVMLGAIGGPPKRVSAVTNGAGITKRFSGSYNETSGGYYSQVSYANGLVKEEWYDDEADLVQRNLDGQTVYNRATVGRVERITTRGNSVTINEYDEFDKLIRATSPSGYTESWTYLGELDRLASYTDVLGAVTTYTYDDDLTDSDPQLTTFETEIKAVPYAATRAVQMQEVSADGSFTRISYDYYDDLDRMVLEVDALGYATAYTYKEMTNLILEAKRLDINGGHVLYSQTFDPFGYLETRTDAEGNFTTYDYDPAGRLLSMTNALQETTRYSYSGDDLIEMEEGITLANPAGRITRYRYDGDGRRTEVIRVDDNGVEHLYMTSVYDSEGRLARMTNADGLLTQYSYDVYGNQNEMKLPLPAARDNSITATHSSTSQQWNAFGDLLVETTAGGLSTDYTYDKEGRVSSAIEGLGLPGRRGMSYRYDAQGNITEMTYLTYDESGNEMVPLGTTESVYDGFGRLISQSGYGVYAESYTYDLNNKIKTVTDARGLITRYVYDDWERIYQIYEEFTDPANGTLVSTLVATREYDDNSNLIKTTDAVGDHQHFAYDALDRQIYQSIPLPAATTMPDTWWSDFANVALENSYTRFGQLATTRQAYGELTTNTYDDFGRLETVTVPAGGTTTYEYTSADQIKRIIFPVVSTSAQSLTSEIVYTYDPLNPSVITSETARSGEKTAYYYDDALRRVRVDLPTGAIRVFTYDAFERMASQTDYSDSANYVSGSVYRTTEYTDYDDFDRLLVLTLPDGEGTQHSEYDDKGNLAMSYGFEADGSTHGGNTYPVIYSYDATGNLSTLTTYFGDVDWSNPDANLSVTTWEYDLRGRLARKVYADNSDVDYTYYDNNRLATRTNARQQTTTYTYDAWGNPDLIDYPADALDTDIDFTYVKGRRQAMVDASGTTSWTYHPLSGLLYTESKAPTEGESYSLEWLYDSEGRRTQMLLDGLPVTIQSEPRQTVYNYDRYGRLELIQDSRAHSSEAFVYSYQDTTGLLETVETPWQLSEQSAYLRHSMTYDSYGRLESRQLIGSNNVNKMSVEGIAYDTLDRRTSQNLLGGTLYSSQQSRAYDYDTFGQLKEQQTDSAVTQTYEFDPIGNRLNFWEGPPVDSVPVTSYTPNSLNQYTAIGRTEPGSTVVRNPDHDDDGNLEEDGEWTYTWNTENRLVAMDPIGPTEGSKRLAFVYDGQGRRTNKKVETYTSGTWVDSESFAYLYDGWNLITELKSLQTSPFTLQTSYTWGLDLSGSLQGAGGVGGLLAVVDQSGSTFSPTYDSNGNVMGYFATDTEVVVAEYEYGPFGELIRATGPKKDEFSFRFSTKYEDEETGLYYYGYRYYDAVTGRWLSRDPIEERGGLNLYAMVENDLINYIDLRGLVKHPGGYTGPVPEENRSPSNPVNPVLTPNYKVPSVQNSVVLSPSGTEPSIPRGRFLGPGSAGAAGGIGNLIGQVKQFKGQLSEVAVLRTLAGVRERSLRACQARRRLAGVPEGCGCCTIIMIVSQEQPATIVRGFFGGRTYLPPSGKITQIHSFHINFLPKPCDKAGPRGGIPYMMFGEGHEYPPIQVDI